MRLVAKALLAALFAVCVYRAFTQSLVYDEALTHELYILGPFENIFHYFDPNHHFLNTVLMRLATSFFGTSEWALRLPALAGAALYFFSAYRLALAAFGESVYFLLAVALLSLNPFVLDFMVAARGYGLALAFLMLALAMLTEAFSMNEIPPKKLVVAGSALGLSVAANLIFVLPAVGVAGTAICLLPRKQAVQAAKLTRRHKPKDLRRLNARPFWVWLAVPMLAVWLLLFLSIPLENLRMEQFYTGANSIKESLRSLATVSLEHSGPLRTGRAADLWRDAVAFGVAPLVVACGFAVGLWKRERLLLLTGAPVVLASVALLMMHYLLGRPYPADRTGIYFAPLVCLLLVGLARAVKSAAGPVFGLVAILLIQFGSEFNTRKFWVWEYDADTREIGLYIARHRKPSGDTVVGGSWQLTESMSYYMFRNEWKWLAIERRAPQPGYDYYMLIPQDARVAESLGLTVVYKGPVSGSVLAVPAHP